MISQVVSVLSVELALLLQQDFQRQIQACYRLERPSFAAKDRSHSLQDAYDASLD
jgi:hypothetical protein